MKEYLIRAICEIFGGQNFISIINANGEFNGYENVPHAENKFFYLATQGGIEQEINAELAYNLNTVIQGNVGQNDLFVLRERSYQVQNIQDYFVNEKFQKKTASKVDIVGGYVQNILPLNFGIMLGHNYVLQTEIRQANNMILGGFGLKIATELLALQTLGLDSQYFVAIFSDLMGNTACPFIKYGNKPFIRDRSNLDILERINGYRQISRLIDPNFSHLVAYSGNIMNMGLSVSLHFMILERESVLSISESPKGVRIEPE